MRRTRPLTRPSHIQALAPPLVTRRASPATRASRRKRCPVAGPVARSTIFCVSFGMPPFPCTRHVDSRERMTAGEGAATGISNCVKMSTYAALRERPYTTGDPALRFVISRSRVRLSPPAPANSGSSEPPSGPEPGLVPTLVPNFSDSASRRAARRSTQPLMPCGIRQGSSTGPFNGKGSVCPRALRGRRSARTS
jgi:hypothetical protein